MNASEKKEICSKCSNFKEGIVNTCDVCGCAIFIITEIPSRKCPEGKW
jgi:uncharacterized protein YutD